MPQVDYDKKLADLNIKLPTPTKPLANYVDVVQAGKLLFLAGKGPKDADGNYVKGKTGRNAAS